MFPSPDVLRTSASPAGGRGEEAGNHFIAVLQFAVLQSPSPACGRGEELSHILAMQ